MLQLKLGSSYTNYDLFFHELTSTSSECIYEDDKVSVYTLPLAHRVYTNGFLFKEKNTQRKLKINEVLNLDIDVSYYNSIKAGKDVPNNKGELIANTLLTDPPKPNKSYAFCSDTAYLPSLIPLIKDVTVLYHESTFLDEHEHLCEKTMHSTAKQAALIAKQAAVKTLVLGHFSTRYGSIEYFKEEASEIFDNVLLADDGKVFDFS